MRKSFVAGNWKMHGTQQSASALLSNIITDSASLKDACEIAVFPPFVHLPLCQTQLSQTRIRYGAQTLSEHPDGAYTGEISASMLRDLGCRYVIIGHSERRQYLNETNALIAKKCISAVNAGLVPILCIGETLHERENALMLSVVQEQLEVVAILKDNCTAFHEIVIAYEPVWAIGTGLSASPEQAQQVHAFIRSSLMEIDSVLSEQTRIVYGGSVKPNNAKALFEMEDIDGALVGGASLDAKNFITIAKACE